jgi:hypothetical protein
MASIVVTDTATDQATGMLQGKGLASGVDLQMSSMPSPASYSGSGSVTFTVQNWGVTASGSLGMPTVAAMQSAPTSMDIGSDFAITNNHCTGMALNPAQTCTYDVVFTAPATGDGGMIGGIFTGTTSVGDRTNSAGPYPFSGAGY